MAMDYPAAPWHLQGFSLQSLHLLDVERVRGAIPPELKIISVFPGKTLGGVYVASYGAGSILQYNELIVVSAGVHRAGQVGGWISHIYVDHPESVAGGREIWGLPKQMAQFTWNHDASRVSVTQDNQLLCVLKRQWQLPGWQQSFTVPVFSRLDAKLQRFEGEGQFKLHPVGTEVDIPENSPIAQLDLGQPWLGFYGSPIHITVQAPTVC
jgi:acetoacetate decarboxylase